MKKFLIIPFIALITISCEQPVSEQDLNQPRDPKTFSLVGKTYISETTYDKSPTEGHYWVFVLNFFSADSVVMYQTPNKDLSYHTMASHTIEPCSYTLSYPELTLWVIGKVEYRPLTFIDTTTLYSSWWERTYTILK